MANRISYKLQILRSKVITNKNARVRDAVALTEALLPDPPTNTSVPCPEMVPPSWEQAAVPQVLTEHMAPFHRECAEVSIGLVPRKCSQIPKEQDRKGQGLSMTILVPGFCPREKSKRLG